MRIRRIRPEFFKSEQIAELSRDARLLFIGLWSIADSYGLLEERPRRIKAEALPYDDVTAEQVSAWLEEIVRAGLMVRYAVGGRPLLWIQTLRKHQLAGMNKQERALGPSLPLPPGFTSDASVPTDAQPTSVVNPDPNVGQKHSDDGTDLGQRKIGRLEDRKSGRVEYPAEPGQTTPPDLDAATIAASPESRWRYESLTSWVRTLKPIIGSKLGAKMWPQYKRLVDHYGINLVEAVAGDLSPDDRWPDEIEKALIRAKADLARKQAIAPDTDPLLDRCQGLIAEHGWEACLAVLAIRNVPDEATLVVALRSNRALGRKLIAHYDPDAGAKAQGAA